MERMTKEQINMYEEYQKTKDLFKIAKKNNATVGEVLHAVAVCLQNERNKNNKCANCKWRCGLRPCVFPESFCYMK